MEKAKLGKLMEKFEQGNINMVFLLKESSMSYNKMAVGRSFKSKVIKEVKKLKKKK